MFLIDKLVESHIQEAQQRGEFDNLPGQGKPLNLDDDSMVPEHLRAGYRLLKNAGYLPPEMQLRKDIADVETLISEAQSDNERQTHQRRLHYLMSQLNAGSQTDLRTEQAYFEKIRDKLNDC